MFVDQVKIFVQAGRGGNGCVSFRREAGVPRGGPDGGRGGNGGSVILVSEAGLTSLSYFRFHPLNRAKAGAPGEGGRRQGKRGADLVLRIPVGTIVKDIEAGELLRDFLKPGERFVAARGGKGGRGNASFATSTHQAPREHEPGRPGEERDLLLELKMIADAGLIGFPNAGKSTLISKISAARPVIADYPFTTLVPNLGVVDAGPDRSFIVADIPGLIEGAHRGQGLGTRFLKHIERTKVLVHVLDLSPFTGRDPVRDFEIVMAELEAFQPGLARRPQILAANKADLLGEGDAERLKAVRNLARRKKLRLFVVSALRNEGIRRLVSAMAAMIGRFRADAPAKEEGR
ncbi:MAG: GTPase ObgE [Candidatus Aminicenantes bacterium]|nr:GTPase ObgE [Candidatus Aminicenantes bacterium]